MKAFLTIICWIAVLTFMQSGTACTSGRSSGNGSTEDDSAVRQLVTSGYRKLNEDKYADAMQLYKKAASLVGDNASDSTRIDYVKALNNIGYIYLFYHNDPKEAFPYLLRAKKVATEHGYNDLLGAVNDNIAKIHDDFGDVDSALDTYMLALKQSVADTTDVSGVIQLMIFNDMVACAMTHDMTGRLSSALDIFDSLPVYPIPMGRYSKEIASGLRLLLQGKTDECIPLIRNAEPLIDSRLDRSRYLTDHQLMLATVYHMRHMPDSAMASLEKARGIAERNGLIDKMPRIGRGMATVLRSRGFANEANEWLLKAYCIDDSIHNAKTYAHISTLEPILDIDVLTREMRTAEAKHRNRLAMLWILSVAIISISILLILLFRRNRRLKASYSELAARHQESIVLAEREAKIRRQYLETIEALKQDNMQLRANANASPAGTLPVSGDAPPEQEGDGPARGKTSLPIDDNERLRILISVNDIMEKSPEVFDADFSIERLAALTDTKQRYLSSVINESIGKSFSRILAETRVRKACEMLLSADFKQRYTVESIALEVGYRSRTQFTSIFKKITGLTPTQYIGAAR